MNNMSKNAKYILVTLITMSIIMGVYEGYLYYIDIEITQQLYGTWSIVFSILLVVWIVEDSKTFSEIYRPYGYGLLMLIFYLPYLPYYLVKTRGFLYGIGSLFGLYTLFNLGWGFQWLIYWAS